MTGAANHDRRSEMEERPSIVLVHGAWADGSSWSMVTEALQADGYSVTAPQFSFVGLSADVARLRHVLPKSRSASDLRFLPQAQGQQVRKGRLQV